MPARVVNVPFFDEYLHFDAMLKTGVPKYQNDIQ